MIKPFKHIHRKGLLLGVSVITMAIAVSGCQAFAFYRQAISGEYQILANQKPILDLMADQSTPPKLKTKFEQVLAIRRFASHELGLPVDGSYLKYVDLQRPFAVWNVYATPELSLKPKTWWFPIVGSVSYRGYFSKKTAQSYGDKLTQKGYDVFLGGVETYSTLGWFRDPLLNTFIDEPEIELADIIFHELAHQRLYIGGDTDFDEAFATAVAQEGVHRWLQARHQPEAYAEYLKGREETERFVQLIKATRQKLEAVYLDYRLSDATKLQRKDRIIAELRQAHRDIKAQLGGKSRYDGFFAGQINNAKLNTVSTYHDLVPAFHELLRANGGDLNAFYKAAAKIGHLPKAKRVREMGKLLEAAEKR